MIHIKILLVGGSMALFAAGILVRMASCIDYQSRAYLCSPADEVQLGLEMISPSLTLQDVGVCLEDLYL